MAGEIGYRQLITSKTGANKKIILAHYLIYLLHQQVPVPVSIDVFHCGDKAGGTKLVRPVALALPGKQIVHTRPRELIKLGCTFRSNNDPNNIEIINGRIWKINRYQCSPQFPVHLQYVQLISHGVPVSKILFCIGYLHFRKICFSGVIKWHIHCSLVLSVCAVQIIKHYCCIFSTPANGPYFVQAITQCHSSCATDAAKCRPETGCPTCC